jgi:hypothetical protein
MAKITRLLIVYEEDSADSSEPRLINLPAMQRTVRAERLAEILDDLVFACRDVLAGKDSQAHPPVSLRRIK